MSTNTAKYVIPQLTTADALSATPTVLTNLANRLDLLLGESGSFVASPAAGVTLTTPITLSRTYPGSNVAAVPGIIILNLIGTTASGTTWNWWVNTWTGSASTITGFSLLMQWSAAQASRSFLWRFFPVL